jgi:hypothetical protein
LKLRYGTQLIAITLGRKGRADMPGSQWMTA